MKTMLDEPQKPVATALFVVSKDGTIISAADCVVVMLEVERADELTDNASDSSRFLIAEASPSAHSASELWWKFKEEN